MDFCTKYLLLCAGLFTLYLPLPAHGQQTILSPACDVYVITFGGGEGGNPFLKYDITGVPAGRVIDSVLLTAYVWQVNANWDGDVNYWNVNGQSWVESDSSRLIWNLPTSQLTSQTSGFGTAVGWTRSIDLKSIFLIDYNAGNTYCSIKMKDPDDPTFNPAPGSYAKDPNDTISIGNRVSNQNILFYPHEYANAPPWLIVFHHFPGGVEETEAESNRPFAVSPNPCRTYMNIRTEHSAKSIALRIYDVTGKITNFFSLPNTPATIRWNGSDQSARPLPSGIYFIEVSFDGRAYRHRVVLAR
jgi:hypothetical protein